MSDQKKIPVTKPFMPPREEYEEYLKGVWNREYLTNNGPLVQRLEKELIDYLDVPNLLYVSNGTIALQIAIKALGLKGEVITTPFSYVATTSSLVWEGCKPVFVDIDPDTLNINPGLIEEAITEETTGILATHVFGNPCDIEAIQGIAGRHDLKVIYDAAHCFGTKYKGKSIFEYGDISTVSFHATKLFHTVEGGAVITDNSDLNYTVGQMRNFGHAGFGRFDKIGINGKNSELHAAIGLCNIEYVETLLNVRAKQYKIYDQLFDSLNVGKQKIIGNTAYNYSYYPVIFNTEKRALSVKEELEKHHISPRRYFYPSLNEIPYVKGHCPVSVDISKRILCLPLYHKLKSLVQETIKSIIFETITDVSTSFNNQR